MTASDFTGLVPECCSEVLDAMYFTTMLGSEVRESLPEELAGRISSDDAPLSFSLRFVGDISGRFGVSLDHSTARSLAANFLGEDEADASSGTVAEVVGELANMLCGSVMSRVEGDNKFVLSHPEPASPPSFSSADDLLVSALETDSGVIAVWVAVEGDPCR